MRPAYGDSMGGRILMVDDDRDGSSMLAGALRARGFVVETVASGVAAIARLADGRVDVVLAHLRMTGMSGVELCAVLRDEYPDVLTIVVTGSDKLDGAIAAIRAGAYDYVTRSVDLAILVIALDRAMAHVTLQRELHQLRIEVGDAPPLPNVIGTSVAMRKVVEVVRKIADGDVTALIVGESGTGKELVARAIHEVGTRRDQPFVALNCAAMPPELIASELFGHVKGSFTDAQRSRPGLFVKAGKGTILLDEIGEMPLAMQAKLLRTLQERCVRPVGSDTEVPFEARVIAATNRALETDVAAKRFREDLFYRINVVQIVVPPLRERLGDLSPLLQHFLQKIGARTGKPASRLSEEATRLLVDYDWPGNVRELENCLERAVALCRGDEITDADLPAKFRDHRNTIVPRVDGAIGELVSLAQYELRYVGRVMSAVGGNKTQAAKILGIDRRSLYRRLDGEPATRIAYIPR
jgi:two-component system, NtrC family, response regulator AtoC